MVAYIIGADSQIDNAFATVFKAFYPLIGGFSEAIGNVFVGLFVQAVTNDAVVFVSNLIGGTEFRVHAKIVGRLIGDYSHLANVSSKSNVDASNLQDLNKQRILYQSRETDVFFCIR